MSHQAFDGRRRRQLSLTLRVSAWLMVAAVAPLIITVICSELLARPALTAQANTTMQSDAKTRVQLIDTYFRERQLDAATLSQVPTVQEFLATGTFATNAGYALAAGIYRDRHYTTWALFDAQGHPRLFYPPAAPPQPHGQYLVPPEDLQAVTEGPAVALYQFDSLRCSTARGPLRTLGWTTHHAPDPRFGRTITREQFRIEHIVSETKERGNRADVDC